MAEVPILPPEESQRMGYPLIAALEARITRCAEQMDQARFVDSFATYDAAARKSAYEDALELVRGAHRAYGGD